MPAVDDDAAVDKPGDVQRPWVQGEQVIEEACDMTGRDLVRRASQPLRSVALHLPDVNEQTVEGSVDPGEVSGQGVEEGSVATRIAEAALGGVVGTDGWGHVDILPIRCWRRHQYRPPSPR